ncbi:hypothetical protein SLS59_003266 [Nothophoma quercina]|uniref:Uncharacterized protein n=1 Tax=Nothophoma quercina TaxID=749835 RepID=A0ABR3RM08_9PLEO
MADGPRSLLRVAIEEETVERREQTKYTAWIRSMAAASAAVETKGADMMAKSVGLYAEQSDTLTQWIESSTKEELLAWLGWNGNDGDNLDSLHQEGIFDLREYILTLSNNGKVQNAQMTIASRNSVIRNNLPHLTL